MRLVRHPRHAAPVFLRSGGSIPVVNTCETLLGIPTVLMGFALPDDRMHAPNEKFGLRQLQGGIATAIHFLGELATQRSASDQRLRMTTARRSGAVVDGGSADDYR